MGTKSAIKKYEEGSRDVRALKNTINKLEGWAVYQRVDSLGLSHKGTFDDVKYRLFRYEILKIDPEAPYKWDVSLDEK